MHVQAVSGGVPVHARTRPGMVLGARTGTAGWVYRVGTPLAHPARYCCEEDPRSTQRSGPPEVLQGLEWGGVRGPGITGYGVGRAGRLLGPPCGPGQASRGPPCPRTLRMPSLANKGEIP